MKVRMPESKNITPATTPANPPHLTMSCDILPPSLLDALDATMFR